MSNPNPSQAVCAAVTKTTKGNCLWFLVEVDTERLWWGHWRYTCGDVSGYGRTQREAWERTRDLSKVDRISSVYPVEYIYSGDRTSTGSEESSQ